MNSFNEDLTPFVNSEPCTVCKGSGVVSHKLNVVPCIYCNKPEEMLTLKPQESVKNRGIIIHSGGANFGKSLAAEIALRSHEVTHGVEMLVQASKSHSVAFKSAIEALKEASRLISDALPKSKGWDWVEDKIEPFEPKQPKPKSKGYKKAKKAAFHARKKRRRR